MSVSVCLCLSSICQHLEICHSIIHNDPTFHPGLKPMYFFTNHSRIEVRPTALRHAHALVFVAAAGLGHTMPHALPR